MTSANKRVCNIDISRFDLPHRLKSLRQDQGLTITDLADKAGVCDRTIADIELGRRERVLENTLIRIAKALGTTIGDLLGEPVREAAVVPPPLLPVDEAEASTTPAVPEDKADEPTPLPFPEVGPYERITPPLPGVATDEPTAITVPEVETGEPTEPAVPEVEASEPTAITVPEVETGQPTEPAVPEVEASEPTAIAVPEVETGEPTALAVPEVEAGEPTALAVPEVEAGESTIPLLRADPARVPSARVRRPRRHVVSIAALLFLLLVMAVLVLRLMFWQVRAERGNGGLVGRNALGEFVWHYPVKSTIEFLDESPWHDGTVLVGLRGDGSDGGRVMLMVERSRRVIWEVSPEQERFRAVYGADLIDSGGGFTAFRNKAVDIDGDGTPELALLFIHGRFFPASVVLVERDGRRLGQYDTKGHLYDLLGEDIDGDGKEELLMAGTNNEPCYQGATVILLDDVCHHGAAQDSIAGGNPAIPDSARVRLVLPQFGEPYMTLLGRRRIEATDLMVFRETGGVTRIAVNVGVDGMGAIVTMDAGLHPLRVQASDRVIPLAETWPDSVTALRGFPRQEWLENEWLPRAVRFEAGHWGAGKGTPGG